MAFDPMGNFSRVHSWQQDRDNGIRILADRHDQEDDNFAGGFNLCFLRTGTVPMTGNLQMGGNSIHTIKAGSEAAPSVTWELSNSTGLWQSSPASIAVSSNGVKRFEVNNTGVGIFGDTAFNGNVNIATGNLSVTGTITAIGKIYGNDGFLAANTSYYCGPNVGFRGINSDEGFVIHGVTVPHYGIQYNAPDDAGGNVIGHFSSYGGLRYYSSGAELGRWDAASLQVNTNMAAVGNLNVFGDVAVQGAFGVTGAFSVANGPTSGEIARFYSASARGAGNMFIGFYDTTGRKAYLGWGGNDDTMFINNNDGTDMLISTPNTMSFSANMHMMNVSVGTVFSTSSNGQVLFGQGSPKPGSAVTINDTFHTPATAFDARTICLGESSGNPEYFMSMGMYYAAGWNGSLNVVTAGGPGNLILNASGGPIIHNGPTVFGPGDASNLTHSTSDGSINICGGSQLSYGGQIVLRGYQQTYNPDCIEFSNGGGERMRLTAYGKLLIGQNTTLINSIIGSGNLRVECAAEENSMAMCTHGPGAHYALQVVAGGNHVGGVATDGSATQFFTMSDGRMKDNVRDCDDAGEVLDRVNIVAFDFPDTGYHVPFGVVAQELKEIYPSAVYTPPENPTSPDQDFWGVDYSKLVPMLVKEIQSSRKRIAHLEAHIHGEPVVEA